MQHKITNYPHLAATFHAKLPLERKHPESRKSSANAPQSAYFMENLDIHGLAPDHHQCTSHREGDWITWKCPYCRGYERKMNWKTGEMRLKTGGSQALHSGSSTKESNMEALTRYNFPN